MKPKATHSTLLKCIAFFLCVCFALAGSACALGAAYLAEDGYYSGERSSFSEGSLYWGAIDGLASAAQNYFYYSQVHPSDGFSTEQYERMLDPARTNYRYTIYDSEGRRVMGTEESPLPLDEARWHGAVLRFSRDDEGGQQGDWYELVSTLDPDLPVPDALARLSRAFDRLVAARDWLIVLGALALILAAALFVFLMCAAGRYPDAEKPECRNLDRAPFDLYLAACIGLVVLFGYITVSFGGSVGMLTQAAFGLVLLTACYIVLLALCMSFAARVKCRELFHNTVIGWILRQIWRFIKWCCRGLRAGYWSLPVLWKALLVTGAFLLLDVILINVGRHSAFAALLCIALNIAAVAFVCAVALQMKRLQKGAETLAEGDFANRLDTGGLYSEFKKHAESLNGIGAGMGRAVEARMKSERMKTDLITNVSHDLKTPLTSIVNYVDLLKKEELAPPSDEYVAVLERQAQRLKKLAEDVVEASKASSGALNVNLQPADLCELVRQSMAEYSLRLTENGLTPVVSLPETPLTVLADGRLLWRALDNLLSNAAKYALTGTRVYITAAADGDKVRLSVKNVSREPLNIDPAELTERFVRGDASRSAEGSGLGLSIAQSLVTLQNGTLTLSIDGDLFKAEIALPTL